MRGRWNMVPVLGLLSLLTWVAECAFTLEHANGHKARSQLGVASDLENVPSGTNSDRESASSAFPSTSSMFQRAEHGKGGDFSLGTLATSHEEGRGSPTSTAGLGRRYIGNQFGALEPLAHPGRISSLDTASSRTLVDEFLPQDLSGMTSSPSQRRTNPGPSRKKLKHFELKLRDLTPWKDYKLSPAGIASGAPENQITPSSSTQGVSPNYAPNLQAIHLMAQSYAYPESNGLSQTDRDYFRMIRTENGFTDVKFYKSHLEGGPDRNGLSSHTISSPPSPSSSKQPTEPLKPVPEINLEQAGNSNPREPVLQRSKKPMTSLDEGAPPPILSLSTKDKKMAPNDCMCLPVEIHDDTFCPKPACSDYPFTWTPLSKEEKMKRREIYFAHGPWCVSPKASMLDLIVSNPGKVLMPRSFAAIAEEIYNFELRPDDVFVVTYPKCGTTWTQEMVWQILHGFDTKKGEESLLTRSPFLEMQALIDPKVGSIMDKQILNSLEAARNLPSPRVIKTHLPIDMLPPQLLETCKVVFVARNPMDCAVSFFHHEKLVPQQGFAGTFDQYAELFRNGKNPMGDYFYHLKSGWSRREHPNLEFIWFEDMKHDLDPIIRRLCSFLGYRLTEKTIGALEAHLHIDKFRKNKSVNMESNYSHESSNGSFIRKGSVGGWRKYFTPARIQDWKLWVKENTCDMNGLSFDI